MYFYQLFLPALLVISAALYAGDFVIIVNTGNPITSISEINLKRLYTGKIKELNGVLMVPVDMSVESPAAAAFLKETLGMAPDAYKEFWIEQQVKGLGTAPMIQKTASMVKAIISQLPGGIGYIPEADLDDTVKKIKVE